MEFIYPYNFVRFAKPDIGTIRDDKYMSHSSFRNEREPERNLLKSGKLICSIEVKTPTFIQESLGLEKGISNHRRGIWDFYNIDGKYCIPPTSMKGMLRSFMEALTDSCMSVLQGDVDLKDFKYKPCNKLKELCPACKIFGIVSNEQALAGKVNLSFAKPEGDLNMIWLKTNSSSAGPKLQKKDRTGRKIPSLLYFDNGKPRGRKFYWHHNMWEDLLDKVDDINSITISESDIKDGRGVYHCIKEGIFNFEVDYYNLTDRELLFLIFSLELMDNMWHKIGKDKALGLGSIKITVKEQFVIDRANRYESITGDGMAKRADFDKFKKAMKGKLFETLIKKENIKDLAYILKANHNKGLELKGKTYSVVYPQIDKAGIWYRSGNLPSVKNIIEQGIVCNY
jgi:CRISPR/Cas system CSM-associated protein Csm3 (group 7 of RAMP superfamily)